MKRLRFFVRRTEARRSSRNEEPFNLQRGDLMRLPLHFPVDSSGRCHTGNADTPSRSKIRA